MNKNKFLSYFNNTSAKDWQDWRWQFKNRVTRIKTLEHILGKTDLCKDKLKEVISVYPLAITPYYLSLMQNNNINDPILAQCVPDLQEISCPETATKDPLEEDSHMPVPKLVHRYPGSLSDHRY